VNELFAGKNSHEDKPNMGSGNVLVLLRLPHHEAMARKTIRPG
jgi:hypothetical protein